MRKKRNDCRQVAVGLAMTRNWPGPALVKNVRVVGFDPTFLSPVVLRGNVRFIPSYS